MARATTTWPMLQLEDGVNTWVRIIKIPRFLAVLGGTGILAKNVLACAVGPLGVEFGFLASFFSTSINKKKIFNVFGRALNRAGALIKTYENLDLPFPAHTRTLFIMCDN